MNLRPREPESRALPLSYIPLAICYNVICSFAITAVSDSCKTTITIGDSRRSIQRRVAMRLLIPLILAFFLSGCTIHGVVTTPRYDPPPSYVYFMDYGCWADDLWYEPCQWYVGKRFGYYYYHAGHYYFEPLRSWRHWRYRPPPRRWREVHPHDHRWRVPNPRIRDHRKPRVRPRKRPTPRRHDHRKPHRR